MATYCCPLLLGRLTFVTSMKHRSLSESERSLSEDDKTDNTRQIQDKIRSRGHAEECDDKTRQDHGYGIPYISAVAADTT